MRMDQIYRTSGRVETDDLDWREAAAVGLTTGEVFALTYFADVEGQTVHYLRDLLRSRLARDPDVLGFLSIWSYEEYFHGQALALLLEACGHPLDASRVCEVRRAARPAERLEALGTLLGARIFPRSFPALYLAWGATQELTTLRGYEALQARTGNPVLAKLCRRIARQERRHYAWYFHSARLLLERSAAARRLTRFALERFWAPVGVAVKGATDARRLLSVLFPGDAFAGVAADVDARIGALPGLAGIRLLRAFSTRAASRSPAEPAAPSMAVVLGGASRDVGPP
jgi:rubrerythrin